MDPIVLTAVIGAVSIVVVGIINYLGQRTMAINQKEIAILMLENTRATQEGVDVAKANQVIAKDSQREMVALKEHTNGQMEQILTEVAGRKLAEGQLQERARQDDRIRVEGTVMVPIPAVVPTIENPMPVKVIKPDVDTGKPADTEKPKEKE